MIEQRSEEWRLQRAGLITASRFCDVIAVRKDGKPTSERMKYLRELAFERTAGQPRHAISSKSLSWGTDVEAFAREAYEIETGLIVTQSEFVTHPKFDFIGCSPDGRVGADGGIEMKCPHDEAVHIQTWLDRMPADHLPQVQGNMACTGAKWWDFVSYDPRQRDGLRLYIERIDRDDAYIAQLVEMLVAFDAEVRAMVACLIAKAA